MHIFFLFFFLFIDFCFLNFYLVGFPPFMICFCGAKDILVFGVLGWYEIASVWVWTFGLHSHVTHDHMGFHKSCFLAGWIIGDYWDVIYVILERKGRVQIKMILITQAYKLCAAVEIATTLLYTWYEKVWTFDLIYCYLRAACIC